MTRSFKIKGGDNHSDAALKVQITEPSAGLSAIRLPLVSPTRSFERPKASAPSTPPGTFVSQRMKPSMRSMA